MPRRRSTWGTNEAAGRGYRRLRYWADEHDGRGYARHSKTIRGTRRDGDEELARLRVLHSEDRPVPTVRQAYETWWLPDARARVEAGDMSQSSLANYESRWRRHVEPTFGGMPASGVSALGISEWVDGMGATTARQSLRVLRQVIDFCVLYGYMDANPAAARVRMPSDELTKRKRGVYDARELGMAVEAARGTCAFLPAILCGYGSCRVGEALGIRAADVTVREANGMRIAVAWVRRQVLDRAGVTDRLKTQSSERPVVIPEPWSLEVLAARDSSEDGWLCGNGVGEPLTQHSVRRAWNGIAWPAGIERIPMSNLRNTWRTVMRWELEVPEDMCERMMGHAGKNVGEIHYDRPREEYFADVVSAAWCRWLESNS